MSAESWDTLGTVAGALLGVLTLLGLAIRYALLPWLEDRFQRLERPAKQNREAIEYIKKQVGENHHSNEEPTLLDRLDDVKTELQGDVADIKQDIKLVVTAYEGRTQQSEDWMRRTEDALAALSAEIQRMWSEVDDLKRQPPAS